ARWSTSNQKSPYTTATTSQSTSSTPTLHAVTCPQEQEQWQQRLSLMTMAGARVGDGSVAAYWAKPVLRNLVLPGKMRSDLLALFSITRQIWLDKLLTDISRLMPLFVRLSSVVMLSVRSWSRRSVSKLRKLTRVLSWKRTHQTWQHRLVTYSSHMLKRMTCGSVATVRKPNAAAVRNENSANVKPLSGAMTKSKPE